MFIVEYYCCDLLVTFQTTLQSITARIAVRHCSRTPRSLGRPIWWPLSSLCGHFCTASSCPPSPTLPPWPSTRRPCGGEALKRPTDCSWKTSTTRMMTSDNLSLLFYFFTLLFFWGTQFIHCRETISDMMTIYN